MARSTSERNHPERFAMTKPEVGSSDATNIRSTITRDGDEYVLEGRKRPTRIRDSCVSRAIEHVSVRVWHHQREDRTATCSCLHS